MFIFDTFRFSRLKDLGRDAGGLQRQRDSPMNAVKMNFGAIRPWVNSDGRSGI